VDEQTKVEASEALESEQVELEAELGDAGKSKGDGDPTEIHVIPE
jgi:hypothetical protein